ncbi:MAG TPA: hypothetical protein VLT84_12425 [Acidobacteriota bacterium]|nr:hypothetical protein [Acidobacteriota bacterium]
MPRTLGPHPGRIALAVALAIAGGFLVSGLTARPHESTKQRPETTVAAVAPAPVHAPDLEQAEQSEQTRRPEPRALPADPEPYAAAGMIVGIDPETGKIGKPTPDQRAEIERSAPLASPAFDRSGEGLTVVHRPDGSTMADLQGRFQEYTVVRIGPDGTKSQVCVQHPELEAALAGSPAAETEPPAPAAPKAEER